MSTAYSHAAPDSIISELIECSTGTEDAAPVGPVGFRLFRTLLSLMVVVESVAGNLAAGQLRCWWFCPWLGAGVGGWVRLVEQDLQVVAGPHQAWSRLLPAMGRVVWLPHGCGAGAMRVSIGALVHW